MASHPMHSPLCRTSTKINENTIYIAATLSKLKPFGFEKFLDRFCQNPGVSLTKISTVRLIEVMKIIFGILGTTPGADQAIFTVQTGGDVGYGTVESVGCFFLVKKETFFRIIADTAAFLTQRVPAR